MYKIIQNRMILTLSYFSGLSGVSCDNYKNKLRYVPDGILELIFEVQISPPKKDLVISHGSNTYAK